MMMRIAAQSQLDIRIGVTSVTGELTQWRGGETRHATAIAAGDDAQAAMLTALDTTVTRLISTRRLSSPRVSIAFSGAFVRSGVMRFAGLPRGAADRALVVAQRFCRDHKLDARSTAVAFSAHPLQDGQTAVLADAAPRAMIDCVIGACAGHGLYCDVLTSDLSLALSRFRTSRPGLLAVLAAHGCTLLILDRFGAPASVATLADDDQTLAQRLTARIERYATQCGVAPAQLALHLSDASGMAPTAVAALFGISPASDRATEAIVRRRSAATASPANFSRDVRRPANVTAGAALAMALCSTVTAIALAGAARESTALATTAEARVVRLERDIAANSKAAADAPASGVFAGLRERIATLNALDYGTTPSVGGLLDVLEQTLPSDAILTNIDYDRNKGAADLVASSGRSQELTQLFDVLDGHALFAKVRLLDKKQVTAAGSAQTQVHLLLDVAQTGAGKAEAGRKR